MTQAQTYTRTEADPRDFPVRLKNAFDDGDVIGDGWEVNRWQKYGNDRLYFENADGYIDVESGAVKEGAPVTDVEVEQVKGDTWVHYYAEETDIDHTTEKFVAAIKR